MNWFHRRLCASDNWARLVAEVIVPATVDGVDLGADVLEIGPGYGATTAPLAERVGHLTALENDPALATRLGARYPAGGRVTVVQGDGAAMPFPDGRFSAVFCATMLHHVPSVPLQDKLFAEACRVLAPGRPFVAADSLPSLRFRLIHLGDTMVTLDPRTLADRLRAAGFADVDVQHGDGRVRFVARTKPSPTEGHA